MTRKWFVLASLIGMLLLIPVALAQTTIIVTPEAGEIGTAFEVSATELDPNTAYDLEFRFDGDVVFTTTEQTDAEGTLIVNIFSEESDPPGEYEVTLLDGSESLGTETFTLLEAGSQPETIVPTPEATEDTETDAPESDTTPQPEQPQAGSAEIRLVPRTAPVGSTHNVFVTGLEPEQDVTITIVSDETGAEVYTHDYEATDSGRLDIEIYSTEEDTPGDYTLSVLDASGSVLSSITLTLEELAGRIGNLTIEPSTANPGETMTFTLTDVRPFNDFEILIRNIETSEPLYQDVARANADGVVTLEFISDAQAAEAEYEVIITEEDTRAIVATSEITLGDVEEGDETTTEDDTDTQQADTEPGAATITISPESGNMDTVFDVQIDNLTPNATFTFEVVLDETGETVYTAERTADEDGHYATMLGMEEGDPTGQYHIVVSQDGDPLAEASLEVLSADAAEETSSEETTEETTPESSVAVSIDPTGGEIGTDYTIRITGLEADETVDVDIRYQGDSIYTTQATADSDGSAIVGITSDSSDTVGQYEVVILREDTELASTPFAVGEELDAVEAEEGETAEGEEEVIEAEPFEGTIEVSPESAPRNSTYDVTIEGLNADETVTIQVSMGEIPVYTTEKTADAAGSVLFSLTTGDTDAAGVYTVSILRPAGEDMQSVGSATFTVTRSGGASSIAPTGDDEETAPSDEVDEVEDVEEDGEETGEANSVEGVNETIEGRLSAAAPEDRYVFQGTEGDTLYITLDSDDFDAYLSLEDEQGVALITDDDSNGSGNSAIGPYILPYTGRYTVVSSSYDYYYYGDTMAGDFTLTLTQAQLSAIDYDSPTSVTFTEGDHAIFFSIEAEAGDILAITVEGEDDLDTRLQVFDPDNYVLAEDDDSGMGFNPEISRLIVPASGTYMLGLRPYSYSDTGTVTLTTTREPARSLNDGPATVALSAKQYMDVVNISVAEGETAHINVEKSHGTIGDVTIYVIQDDVTIATFYSIEQPDDMVLSFISQEDSPISIHVEAYTGTGTLELSIAE
ncbi:PPC domain-containing protein [Phototrophicus methaneseepsis]|uniref:PPC domain-containing protein n=1 Tax=Phototrophicus methaneseepsis TaxID=2710758 RepID=A0A7S8E8U1_9CHLR|nr:PPC domain-containing protein [Phototrophicus methaneseepsis]QPC82496.1 PPC domain-containing protein [Phototrophicus methaneseepsis]